jgi:CheY-like chemotaxis protein
VAHDGTIHPALRCTIMPATKQDEVGRVVVLVVEDEPIVRMLVADVFTDAGFDVLQAKTADEGIELLDHEHAIHVVVSDIETPGRHDGFALAWHARLRKPTRPVVLISGQVAPGNDELPSGTRFIQKPVDPGMLVREVRKALNSEHAP